MGLYWAQDQLDYWLEEGGKVDELREQIEGQIEHLAERVELGMREPERVLKFDLVPLTQYYKALVELDEYEKRLEAAHQKPSVEWLIQDFGLYVGNIQTGPAPYTVTPMTYLEDFMEMAWQPPKHTCIAFLGKFHYTPNDIAIWLDKIAWDENGDTKGKIEEVE